MRALSFICQCSVFGFIFFVNGAVSHVIPILNLHLSFGIKPINTVLLYDYTPWIYTQAWNIDQSVVFKDFVEVVFVIFCHFVSSSRIYWYIVHFWWVSFTLADIIEENSFSPTCRELGHLLNKLGSLEAVRFPTCGLGNLASLEATLFWKPSDSG